MDHGRIRIGNPYPAMEDMKAFTDLAIIQTRTPGLFFCDKIAQGLVILNM